MLTLEALQLFSDKMLAIPKLSNMHSDALLLIFFCPNRCNYEFYYLFCVNLLFISFEKCHFKVNKTKRGK